MLVNMMMNDKEIKAYRKAYQENNVAQQTYNDLYDYITANPQFRCLPVPEQRRLNKELQKARSKCHKTQPKYLALCKKYGIVPGTYV